MPRYVDHERRRKEIFEATIAVISELGLRGLSFRSIADRLGGSTTVVTHYYPTIKDLLDDLTIRLVESWDVEIAVLDADIDDPYKRLWALMTWLLPVDKRGRREERARISLLADELVGHQHRALFNANERRVRKYLREHLSELVHEEELGRTVELLRVVVNGLVLSACEHPAQWPRGRQFAVVELALAGLGISGVTGPPVASMSLTAEG
jgi:AcrR family transcriptional regulator